jgi:predicted nucleotide-binding protein (sugar kinase/HSP70/actin superfamily)
MIEEIS